MGFSMSTEMSILALYGLLVAITILVQVLAAAGQVGLAELAKPRDDMPKLTGTAGRLDRAQLNSVIALAMFAPAVLMLNAQTALTAGTLLAAQIFLAARVVYLIVYITGTPWIRTLAWVVGFLVTVWFYILAL